MQLFYNSELNEHDKNFHFNKNESRHIIKVLRKDVGDKIFITNGFGYNFEGIIKIANQNKCEVSILNVFYVEPKNFKIHLAVAPTKLNERYEWFIEKATEIGVDIITPIFCKNSERKIIKMERYQKVLISAAKQALRMHFPILKEPKSFNEFIKTKFDGKRCIAHCQEKPKERLKDFIFPQKNILLMVGPEGDFSTEEIKLAEKLGFKSVSLGNSRLRTETAAIIACHTIKLFNE